MMSTLAAYTPSLLRRLYRRMLTIRLCEESLVEPILSGRIQCPVHLCTGQEATAVGVCAVLTGRDYVFGSHRSHGHYLAKGGDLDALVAEIYGKRDGCSGGRGGSMHVMDAACGFLGSVPIVGGTIALAVGAGLASFVRDDRRVTVAFFGDGATDEGTFYESLNFAALHRLPVVFACENNLYSTHLPMRECRSELNIARTARALGVRGVRVDGNNVLAVYTAARDAVGRCRERRGPVFMEFLTYRLRGHVGPDDNVQGLHTDIRPQAEVAKWRRRDPIARLGRQLARRRILGAAGAVALQEEIGEAVKAAHEKASRATDPRGSDLPRHVFA